MLFCIEKRGAAVECAWASDACRDLCPCETRMCGMLSYWKTPSPVKPANKVLKLLTQDFFKNPVCSKPPQEDVFEFMAHIESALSSSYPSEWSVYSVNDRFLIVVFMHLFIRLVIIVGKWFYTYIRATTTFPNEEDGKKNNNKKKNNCSVTE